MFKLIYLYLFIINIYKERITSKKSIIIATLIFLILDYILSLTSINQIFITYIMIIIFYRILLNKKDINYYLLSLISLVGLIIYPSKTISILYLLILFLLKRYLIKLINQLNRHKNILYILVLLIYLTVLITLLSRNISINELYNIIFMFIINLLIMTNIDITIKNERLSQKYQDLKIYSKNNDSLVTNYRSMVHENKNQLIIIKSMIPGKKKDLEKYINNLIEKDTKVTNKWLNDLKYIPLPGVKNFINYKLIQMDNLGASIEIFISKELEKIISSKIDIVYLDNFYTIIGVFLDNIIDAIKETEEKLVSINAYMEENITNIELANTYNNEIDINKLNNYGYTTKGNNHGVGLYLVNKIIKNNKTFELNTKIDNNFFVQHLKVHHPKKHIK